MSDEPTAQTPPQPVPPPNAPPPELSHGHGSTQTMLYGRETNGIAIAAGVCGIIAIVLCWIPFVDYLSIVLGVLAIIFGILGLRRADAYGSGRAMAITGIVCGAVGLTIAFLFLLLIYAVISTVTVIGAAIS